MYFVNFATGLQSNNNIATHPRTNRISSSRLLYACDSSVGDQKLNGRDNGICRIRYHNLSHITRASTISYLVDPWYIRSAINGQDQHRNSRSNGLQRYTFMALPVEFNIELQLLCDVQRWLILLSERTRHDIPQYRRDYWRHSGRSNNRRHHRRCRMLDSSEVSRQQEHKACRIT